jgi:hypothetical protein
LLSVSGVGRQACALRFDKTEVNSVDVSAADSLKCDAHFGVAGRRAGSCSAAWRDARFPEKTRG